jgi:hypothetical protein
MTTQLDCVDCGRCLGCDNCTAEPGCYVDQLCPACTPGAGRCLDCADMRRQDTADLYRRHLKETS